MPTGGKFVVLNADQVAKAFKVAPKKMRQGIRREFKRGVTTFRNQTAKRLFRGPPGIHIPAQAKVQSLKTSQKGKTGKESAGRLRSGAERAHVVARTIDKGGFHVLFAYLSRFAEFHRKKLEPIFDNAFKTHARKVITRVRKETARLAQLAIDGKIK